MSLGFSSDTSTDSNFGGIVDLSVSPSLVITPFIVILVDEVVLLATPNLLSF